MTIIVKMLLDNFKFAFKSRKAWWYTATSRSRARFARTTLGSFWLGCKLVESEWRPVPLSEAVYSNHTITNQDRIESEGNLRK